MAAIRSILYLLVQLVTVIPWAFVCLACAPLPLATRYRITVQWPRAMTWAGRWICGLRWEVLGAENLPDGPAILLPKHQSTWETFYLIWAMPRDLCFVFKRELLYVPFFGWGMALLRMIPIDRSKGKDAMAQIVVQGRRRLADGQWIIMFPEGTRSAVGRQGKYKGGGARLAVETGTPVVPIAMNSGECWPRNSFIKKPGLITVSIGKPISPEGLTSAELMQKVETWIESEMRVISPAVYASERTQDTAAPVK